MPLSTTLFRSNTILTPNRHFRFKLPIWAWYTNIGYSSWIASLFCSFWQHLVNLILQIDRVDWTLDVWSVVLNFSILGLSSTLCKSKQLFLHFLGLVQLILVHDILGVCDAVFHVFDTVSVVVLLLDGLFHQSEISLCVHHCLMIHSRLVIWRIFEKNFHHHVLLRNCYVRFWTFKVFESIETVFFKWIFTLSWF